MRARTMVTWGATKGNYSDPAGLGPVSFAKSKVTASATSVITGSTLTLTLQAQDTNGANVTEGGLAVVFTATGGTVTGAITTDILNDNRTHTIAFTAITAGTIGSTTDHANGAYTATYTGVSSGTITGTVVSDINNGDGTHTVVFSGATTGMAASGATIGATLNGEASTYRPLPVITVSAPNPHLTSFTTAFAGSGSACLEEGVDSGGKILISWTSAEVVSPHALYIFSSRFRHSVQEAEIQVTVETAPGSVQSYLWDDAALTGTTYASGGPPTGGAFTWTIRYELRSDVGSVPPKTLLDSGSAANLTPCAI